MTNVLMGSYRNIDTPLHRLDARVKIVCLLLATIALFATKQPLVLVAFAVLALVLARVGHITPQQLYAAAKPAMFILALSLILNMFSLDGTADVIFVGNFGLTWAGLVRGAIAVGRILILVALALVLTATTSSTQVADGLTSLLMPFGRFGLPVSDIAMTVSVALRFIPITAEELVRIRDAQRIRGVKFDEGSLVQRLTNWLSVLTPLVVSLFRNSDDLAKAMRERCYRSTGRTRFIKKLSHTDIAVLVIAAILCIVACVI